MTLVASPYFQWTETMQLPRLDEFGLTQSVIDKVVINSRGSSIKTNPIVMMNEEILELV